MEEGPETQNLTSYSDQSPSQDPINKQTQVPKLDSLKSPVANVPTSSIIYPVLVPGLFPPMQDQEQMNRGPGLYAVPVLPFMQPMTGFPPNSLIPFTYNLPTTPEAREAGIERGQAGERPQQQLQAGPQRQVVVRRFQIAIQLDLFLILKLAAVIFLFNQDGSKQRLTLLVVFASIVYLYQTGALAPVIRWLSQGMQRVPAPPQPPRPAVRGDNVPAGGGPGNEDVGIGEVQPVGESENQQANDGNRALENEHGQHEAGNRGLGFVREIRIIVFGFIASLLPNFQNVE